MEAGLEATFYYMFPHAKPNIVPGADRMVRAQFTFSAGAHAAIVEVDKNTGAVHVIRYLIVGDNGTVINPGRGQRPGLRLGGPRHRHRSRRRLHVQPRGTTVDDYLSRLRQMLDGGDAARRSDPPAVALAVYRRSDKKRRAKARRSPRPPPSPARSKTRCNRSA